MKLTQSPAWRALRAHYDTCKTWHLRELFAADPQRALRYRVSACGLTLDYSKNLLNDETLRLLLQLAQRQSLGERVEAMFEGEKINRSEGRSALHTALRSPHGELWVDGDNLMPAIHAVLERMANIVDAVRTGQYTGYSGKRIRSVVNIGIGGSHLGPKMLARALRLQSDPKVLQIAFISSADPAQFEEIAAALDPETTLFVIVSKTFTTRETLLNAHAARAWFIETSGGRGDVSKHFVAVSANTRAAREFGIGDDNIYKFWDWVGGRYSLWSAVGLSAALYLGMPAFRQLLAGAHAMDEHFRSAPPLHNLPLLQALIGIWYNNFADVHQHLVLPYSYKLRELTPYIQQLDMESNGKSVDIDGREVDYATAPSVWGGAGNDAQHAFFQLLHQGTHWIPADFIVALNANNHARQTALVANCIGQTQALMSGRYGHAVSADMNGSDEPALLAQRSFSGNRPSNTLIMSSLDAYTLGALIALYEHKIFVQGVVWRLNSFDQWGVELGKQLARELEPALTGDVELPGADASTQELVAWFRRAGRE